MLFIFRVFKNALERIGNMKKKKIFKTLLAAGVMVSSIAPSMINVYANENYIEEPEEGLTVKS